MTADVLSVDLASAVVVGRAHVLLLFLDGERAFGGEGVAARMQAEALAETEKAFELALASPNPEEKDLYTHVYSD